MKSFQFKKTSGVDQTSDSSPTPLPSPSALPSAPVTGEASVADVMPCSVRPKPRRQRSQPPASPRRAGSGARTQSTGTQLTSRPTGHRVTILPAPGTGTGPATLLSVPADSPGPVDLGAAPPDTFRRVSATGETAALPAVLAQTEV